MIKIDGNGDLLWDKTFGGGHHESIYDIVETKNKHYAIIGSTWTNNQSDSWLLIIQDNTILNTTKLD